MQGLNEGLVLCNPRKTHTCTYACIRMYRHTHELLQLHGVTVERCDLDYLPRSSGGLEK